MSQRYVRTFTVTRDLRGTLTEAWRRSSEFHGAPVLVKTQSGEEIEVSSSVPLEKLCETYIPSIPTLHRNAISA